jgi:hypothetical protein
MHGRVRRQPGRCGRIWRIHHCYIGPCDSARKLKPAPFLAA